MFLAEVVTDHPSRSDTFRLYVIGDVHVGAKACDRRAFEAAMRRIKDDKEARWIGLGDYAENIIPGDKRWDFASIDPAFHNRLGDLPQACFEYIRDQFEPVKGQCVGLLTGNHEETLRNRHSQDILGALCMVLGVKNLGYNAAIRWTFRRSQSGKKPAAVMILYATHSTIAARKDGSKLNRMADVARVIDADLVLYGHGHSNISNKQAYLGFTRSGEFRWQQRVQTIAMGGTFRRTFAADAFDYSEKAHHDPVVIGCPTVVLKPWSEDPSERITVC